MSTRASKLEHRAFSGSLANIAQIFAILLQNLALVPVLLHYWKVETYGTWITLFAVQSLLFTINYGLEAYVGYEAARLLHVDRAALPALLGTGLVLDIGVGLLEVLLILVAALTHCAGLLGVESGPGTVAVCGVLAIVVGSWVGFGSAANILIRMGYALGFYSNFTFYSVLFRVFAAAAVCLAAVMGAGLWGAAMAYGITTMATQACLMWMALRVIKKHHIAIARPHPGLALAILKNSVVLSGTSLLDAFSNNGLVTIISGVLSPALVPPFSTVRTITNTANQGVGVIMHPLDPDMIRYRAKGEIAKLYEVFGVCWAVAGSAINFGLCMLPLFIVPLYRVWTRGKLSFDFDLFFVLGLSVSFRTFGHPGLAYLQAINAINEQARISVIRAALVVSLSFLFIHLMGVFGVGVALAISEFVGAAAMPLWYAIRSCATNSLPFPYKRMACAGASVITVAVAFLCYRYLHPFRFTIAAAAGTLIVTLFCIEWAMLTDETRRRIQSLLHLPGGLARSRPVAADPVPEVESAVR